MLSPRALVHAAVDYLRRNPEEVVRAARNAAGLRFGVPLAALRYLAGQARGKKVPKDIQIGAAPPALKLAATVDAMGTPLRVSAAVRVDEIRIEPDTLRIAVRLHEVKLDLVGESESPIATLVKSGALDLSKPGNLVKFIPKRPPLIVEAEGDRIAVDLMKVPTLAENAVLRRVLSVVSPLVGVRALETEGDHLYLALRATPGGLLRAAEAVRSALNGDAAR